MKGMMGWVVAVVVIVAAGAFYFWPQMSKAPGTQPPAGSEQMTAQPASTQGYAQMAGMWQSTTDKKFTREIRLDGVMIDHYVGDTTPGIPGQWSVIDPSKDPAVATQAASFEGKPVIKVVWEGGSETTYFIVTMLDAKMLTTVDLSGRGAVTNYTKVQ